MAEIINLDDFIPEDIELVYKGESFFIPGDLDTEIVLKVFDTFRSALALSSSVEETDTKDIERTAKRLNDLLLSIFQIRNPELDGLPFGSVATPIVVQKLLKSLGVDLTREEVPDPPKPAPSRSPRKKPSSSARVPRTRK